MKPRATRRDPVAPRGGMAPIDQIIKRWVKQNKVSRRLDDKAVFGRWNDALWKRIVGDEIAGRTRIVDVVRGELIVEVDSAPLLNELSTYYRQEMLESLRAVKEFQGIHKLRFRTGSF